MSTSGSIPKIEVVALIYMGLKRVRVDVNFRDQAVVVDPGPGAWELLSGDPGDQGVGQLRRGLPAVTSDGDPRRAGEAGAPAAVERSGGRRGAPDPGVPPLPAPG